MRYEPEKEHFLLPHLSFDTTVLFQSPLLSFCSFGPLFFTLSSFSSLHLLAKLAAHSREVNVKSVVKIFVVPKEFVDCLTLSLQQC